MQLYNVAVVGATGMVGRKMLQVLAEEKFPIRQLFCFASARSAGKVIDFQGKSVTIEELTETCMVGKDIDIALFSAGGSLSEKFAPIFAKAGIAVVDNSSCWRMDPDVPLVVPEVNPQALENHNGIIANPNCSTIQAVVALQPLHAAFGLRRVVYSTYQAASGAGQGGYEDLDRGVQGLPPVKFPHPLFNNLIPQIDVFLPTGYTKEEQKMIDETRKIMGLPDLRVTATTVRVPVFHSHSESINLEFERPASVQAAREVLAAAPGVVLTDEPEKAVYPMPCIANDRNEVFVGRIRQDVSIENGLDIFVVADNIRKGAATNTVQIAQALIANNLVHGAR